MKQAKNKKLVIYQTKTGEVKLRGDFDKETIWATQAEMAKIFEVNPQAITKHLKNIYKEGELEEKATCSKMEQVQKEAGREVRRTLNFYNLDAVIAVGYRINSVVGTKFRQWATGVLRQHITKGFTINPSVIKNNYSEFQKAIEHIRALLPAGTPIDHASVLELVSAFADTWLSLESYDEDRFPEKGVIKKKVALTTEDLESAFLEFKNSLNEGDLFGSPRHTGAVAGIVGSIMQTFGGKALYATVEERAAHLLYFFVKNHPFVDGNKRHGAFAFVWFLRRAGIFDITKLTPAALTALTLFVAESAPRNKDQVVGLILQLLKK